MTTRNRASVLNSAVKLQIFKIANIKKALSLKEKSILTTHIRNSIGIYFYSCWMYEFDIQVLCHNAEKKTKETSCRKDLAVISQTKN